tara:strand:+ start:11344 stop:11517 length:174 start_codon:yes stop_codon:yes gene_type:complete
LRIGQGQFRVCHIIGGTILPVRMHRDNAAANIRIALGVTSPKLFGLIPETLEAGSTG